MEADMASQQAAWLTGARDYVALTKPRITFLVLVTTATGYYLGSESGVDLTRLFNTLLGTALVAAGTGAMNQVLERDVDGRMNRTRNRPLPAGRLAIRPAAAYAMALAVFGILFLAWTVNPLTAGLAAATFLMYDFLYTPLKRVHEISTLVGAVPGALPIAGGWAAARGSLEPGALALFAVLFFWQLPHFLALAWMFREDYQRAGLAMLGASERPRPRAGLHAIAYTVALVAVSLLPTVLGLTGGLYFGVALLLGLAFVKQVTEFARCANAATAGRMFRYSILYLPLVLGVAALDKAL
jgi:protoheme IX farnesyltransferase